MTSDSFLKIQNCLACPRCCKPLSLRDGAFTCALCNNVYPIIDGIPDLRPPETRQRAEVVEWSDHWSREHQNSPHQKFFSFYRKFVFAGGVRYFVNKFFQDEGIFVEPGSGTSETSVKIDKRGGARLLVALDLILPVLSTCSDVMDVKLCGDNFYLPFIDRSINGIWNVGVMEHFSHPEIDVIMKEFYRVLKTGGRIVLLWPGTDSVPQKILHMLEKIINMRKRQNKFRFHRIPKEISQINSQDEGREIFSRNGFRLLHYDNGLRTLMAFKILIGEKIS